MSSCRFGELISTVFAAQEWSQNYALMEGVTCSAPEMVDGDIKTFGRSGHQIMINLPERKTIHRLVFRQTNIQDLTLYIDRNNDDENAWMKWEQIDANREFTFEIRKIFNAQRMRILIGATSDDQRIAEELLTPELVYTEGQLSGVHHLSMKSSYMVLRLKNRPE